jgi:hypothetical protein
MAQSNICCRAFHVRDRECEFVLDWEAVVADPSHHGTYRASPTSIDFTSTASYTALLIPRSTFDVAVLLSILLLALCMLNVVDTQALLVLTVLGISVSIWIGRVVFRANSVLQGVLHTSLPPFQPDTHTE